MSQLPNTMNEFLDHLLVVVVIYKEKIEATSAWKSLLGEVAGLGRAVTMFVYDNSPFVESKLPEARYLHLQYHHNASNPGVGVAYNKACQLAAGQGKHWLLLLDQDAEFQQGTLLRYRESLQKFPRECLFAPRVLDRRGFLSPFKYRFGGGRRIKNIEPGLLPLNRFKVINSGLLIRRQAFESAGGFDESVPLDFSDLAFLARAESVATHICIVDASLNVHFSGSGRSSAQEALSRFGKYSLGARNFGLATGQVRELRLRSLARALKMSIRYRDYGFLQTHNAVWL